LTKPIDLSLSKDMVSQSEDAASAKGRRTMRSFIFPVAAILFIGVQSAVAQPVGVYDVSGVNPGDGSTYKGAVAIKTNGATYSVLWRIDGEEFEGTAIGAANVNGSIIFGEAAQNDTALAVSYGAGDNFGLALFVQQENGQWTGIWTYGGSDTIGSETWTPQ
jgi:hypothetical protein